MALAYTNINVELREISLRDRPKELYNVSSKATVPVLIVSDDLHLPFGKIKIKGQGTAGGHNGHKDIIQKLGTKCYARLKFGIGNKFNLSDQSKYVLSDFSKEEKLVIFDFINLTLDAMINFCTLGLNKTMTNLN